MKPWLLTFLLVCAIFSLVACGNRTQSDLNQFEQSMSEVDKKQDHVEKTMDDIHLNHLNELSKSDLTDRNKEEFEQMSKDMDKKLMPAFKSYKEAAHSLPADTKAVKELRTKYLKEVDQQEKDLKKDRDYIRLCNQSVKTNEDILNYTRLFEKRRAQLEIKVADAKKAGENESADALVGKLKDNNKKLQDVAKKYLDSENPKQTKAVIKDKIEPLISKQIEDLNQSTVTDNETTKARQSAIEMYYSLQNYYETRQKTIDISTKLEQYDMNKLPLTGKDLSEYHKNYNKALKRLKEDVN